jgi:hypothetical protein
MSDMTHEETRLREELARWQEGGVTEAVLRRQDGFIKLDRGCVIVIEQEWAEQIHELAQLREQVARLREAMESIRDMAQVDLRTAISTGDELRMLEQALVLFNSCRDIALAALDVEP